MTRVGGAEGMMVIDVTQKENFITMQLLVMFAEVHCGNYSSQIQEEKTRLSQQSSSTGTVSEGNTHT